jgi:hypothetical protein
VLQGDFLHYGEPQACAFRFGGVEGQEDLGQIALRDSRPIVRDADPLPFSAAQLF